MVKSPRPTQTSTTKKSSTSRSSNHTLLAVTWSKFGLQPVDLFGILTRPSARWVCWVMPCYIPTADHAMALKITWKKDQKGLSKPFFLVAIKNGVSFWAPFLRGHAESRSRLHLKRWWYPHGISHGDIPLWMLLISYDWLLVVNIPLIVNSIFFRKKNIAIISQTIPLIVH